MISDLPLLKVYGAMAQHAAESQRISAGNLSHAGQPNYKAVEIESFQAYLERAASTGLTVPFGQHASSSPAAPNGNTVNVEQEIYRSADAAGQHKLALTVYTKSLDLMRAAIGKR